MIFYNSVSKLRLRSPGDLEDFQWVWCKKQKCLFFTTISFLSDTKTVVMGFFKPSVIWQIKQKIKKHEPFWGRLSWENILSNGGPWSNLCQLRGAICENISKPLSSFSWKGYRGRLRYKNSIDWKYRWISDPAVLKCEVKTVWRKNTQVHASIMSHIRPWHYDVWSFFPPCGTYLDLW